MNLAQTLLGSRDGHDVLVFWGEDRVQNRMSHGELYRAVAHFVAALRETGVGEGDSVALCMPNMPEAVVARLAAASIGATFTAVSPALDVQDALGHFSQFQPRVLVACDGYYFDGKTIDVLGKLGAIVNQLPSVKRVVIVPYVHHDHDLSGVPHARMLADFIAPYHFVDDIDFVQSEMSVSQTVVQSADHLFPVGLGPGDRVLCCASCGSKAWLGLMSALASGASLLLYDGSTFVAEGQILFDFADAEKMTHFVAPPGFIDACLRLGLQPRQMHRLDSVRAWSSLDGPLAPEARAIFS